MGISNFDIVSSPGGVIGPSMSMGGVGNIYYVADTTSDAYPYIKAKIGEARNSDGSPMLCPHTATSTVVTTNGFKTAEAACVNDRNDYIIALPSSNNYYIDEVLTLDKRATHLVCPAAMTNRVGCTNLCRLQQIGAGLSIISITNGAIEVAGLYLKNISGYAHITVPTTGTYSAWALSIHNNYFVSRSSTTTLPMLDCNGDGASYSRIENNWFTEQVLSGAWTAGVVDIEGAAANVDVVGNYITIGNSGNATYGIRNLSGKGMVADNYFSETGTSTITSCVTIGATGAAIGNRASVATGHFSDASGTTGVSYTDNTDGITNGASSGNLGAQLQT